MKLPRTLWILLALGALLRVAAIEWRPGGAMLAAPDEPEYLEIAQNIAAGHGFSIHGQPTAYRDMLFPFWAAGKGWVVGVGRGVLYAQLVADLVTALLLFFLVRRRISERAAPVALLAVTGLAYMLLAMGGVAGIFLVRSTPLRGLVMAQLLLATLAALATYGLARYHYPLMPALVIGTASLAQNPKAWQATTRAQRAGAVVIVAVFSVIWLAEIRTIAAG